MALLECWFIAFLSIESALYSQKVVKQQNAMPRKKCRHLWLAEEVARGPGTPWSSRIRWKKSWYYLFTVYYYYTSIYVMFTLNIHCSVVHGNTYVDFRTYVICLLFEYCVGRRRDKALMKRDWFRPVEGNQISRCLRCSLGQDLEDIDMAQRNIVI